jgi:hypothetical protein
MDLVVKNRSMRLAVICKVKVEVEGEVEVKVKVEVEVEVKVKVENKVHRVVLCGECFWFLVFGSFGAKHV